MDPSKPNEMNDVLVDIYPNGTSIFRDISKKSHCYAQWQAALHCFENNLRETRLTQRCSRFMEAWDNCLKQQSPLPSLENTK